MKTHQLKKRTKPGTMVLPYPVLFVILMFLAILSQNPREVKADGINIKGSKKTMVQPDCKTNIERIETK